MLRLAAHRDAVRAAAAKRGWTLLLHRTDRPASEALLALRMRLEAGADPQLARWPADVRTAARLHRSRRSRRVRRPAGSLLSAARDAAAAAARAVSAAAAHSRSCAARRDAGLHALVAARCCAWRSRRRSFSRWPDPSSIRCRQGRRQGALARPARRRLAGGAELGRSASTAAAQWIEAAGRSGETIAVAATSEGGREIIGLGCGPYARSFARDQAAALSCPTIWRSLPAIEKFHAAHGRRPMSSGSPTESQRGHAREFAEKLAHLVAESHARHRAIRPPTRSPGRRTKAALSRSACCAARPKGPAQGIVRALDRKGLTLGEARLRFRAPRPRVPPRPRRISICRSNCAMRSRGSRFSDQHSAGAVSLLDERWKRRRVGIVSGETADHSLPLLAPNYYLTQALAPFADVREARPGTPDPIATLLDDHVAVLILADVGMVSGPDYDETEAIRRGRRPSPALCRLAARRAPPMISCRCGCAAAAACSAARCPGRRRKSSRPSSSTAHSSA